MSRLSQLGISILVTLAWAFSASAGQIWYSNRVWAVQGPGGYYGLIESHGMGVGVGTPDRIETAVSFGPLSVSFGTSAPVVAYGAIVALAVMATGAIWFLGRRKNALGLCEGGGPTNGLSQ